MKAKVFRFFLYILCFMLLSTFLAAIFFTKPFFNVVNGVPMTACLFGRHYQDQIALTERVIGAVPDELRDFALRQAIPYGNWQLSASNISFSADGNYFSYETWHGDIISNAPSGQEPAVKGVGLDHSVAISKDSYTRNGHTISSVGVGGTFGFDTGSSKKSRVLLDGSEVGTYSASCVFYEPVHYLQLSNDGSHYAFRVFFKDGHFVVVDGKKTKLYSYVDNLQFSPDGSLLSFNAMTRDAASFLNVQIPID